MDDAGPRFEDAWSRASAIEGWLTRDQARVLFEAAGSLPVGSTVVEIGSHQGRSTVVLASALEVGSRLVAVDPFDPGWRYGGPSTQEHLVAHLEDAGVTDRVDVMATTSREARSAYDGESQLLYVDGKHDYWTVRDDLRWGDRVRDGGVVLVHDSFSSLGVTLALLRTLPVARRLAYAGRTGSLARLDVRRPGPTDRLRLGRRCRGSRATSSSRCCSGADCVPSPDCSGTAARPTPTETPRTARTTASTPLPTAARGRSSATTTSHSPGSRASSASATVTWTCPAAGVGAPVAGSTGRCPTRNSVPPVATPLPSRRTMSATEPRTWT